MEGLITLKGIAWDHPRGYEPLKATTVSFAKKQRNFTIHWDIRSLKEFGDKPIEDLIDNYDIITVDHPYMGQANTNKLLLPLENILSKKTLVALENQSVGPSFKAYSYNNHLFAVPIDAAAQVAVSRTDLIQQFNLTLPETREELFAFYTKLPADFFVAWPLCPTDLWCSFLTLCAQNAGENFIHQNKVDIKVGSLVLDELKKHLQFLHPDSLNWNPIQTLDSMAEKDQILYSPFLFGYTNYSREGYAKNILRFSNSPKNPKSTLSTILGGVGLAVSVNCKYPDLAVAYLEYVANAEIQQGIYLTSGGQPGNLQAWQNKKNNKICNNFFTDTIWTMQHAYVRPQHPGWNQFQEIGAQLLHNGIIQNIPSIKIMHHLNELYNSII